MATKVILGSHIFFIEWRKIIVVELLEELGLMVCKLANLNTR